MKKELFRQILEFVPLVALVTVGVLTYKLWSLYLLKSRTANNSDFSSTTIWKPSETTPSGGKRAIANSTPDRSLPSDNIPASDVPFLQNKQLTPGSYFPEATRQVICIPGYTKRVRNVPTSLKKEVYNSYGISHHQPGEYEVDHLVSLELGGDNEITNLWPEPYHGQWNAHEKDKLENELHRRVCAGDVPLDVAQREIATDWVAAYRKYIGGEPK